MKKIHLFLIACTIFFLLSACKKTSSTPTAPNTPASSTQWTYNNTTYKGEPAQWLYDSTGMFLYLSSQDSTGHNGLAIAFYETSPTARPAPGKYYFVNSTGSNIPSGVPLSQICIMEVVNGPTNVATSIGGTPADTATVSFNAANQTVVYFNNIAVTGEIKVSGTLVE